MEALENGNNQIHRTLPMHVNDQLFRYNFILFYKPLLRHTQMNLL